EALQTRLRQRKVEVRLNTRAAGPPAGPQVDVDGPGGRERIRADAIVWCAGPPSGQANQRLPLVPSMRTLIRLTEPAEFIDPAGQPVGDITVHTDPPMRMWSNDRLHWTIAHQNAVDPVSAMNSAGL